MAKEVMNKHLRYSIICLPFTALLFLQELKGGFPWLKDPGVQLALCLPVYITGMHFFGRSALKSIRKGRPNMNVLIAVGATAAFVYSLSGTLMGWGPAYLFYETAAAIITFVFLGYYLEDISVRSTQRALDELVLAEKVMANMVAYDDQQQQHTRVIKPPWVLLDAGSQLRAGRMRGVCCHTHHSLEDAELCAIQD